MSIGWCEHAKLTTRLVLLSLASQVSTDVENLYGVPVLHFLASTCVKLNEMHIILYAFPKHS